DGFPVRWQLLRPLEPSELPEPERLGWRSELCSGPGNQSLHRWCLRAVHEDLRRPGWSSCNPASDSVRFLTGAKAEQPFRLAARLAFFSLQGLGFTRRVRSTSARVSNVGVIQFLELACFESCS